MNLSEIQDLIKFVAKSGVCEVEIERKDFKITIKSESKQKEQHIIYQNAPVAAMPQAPVQTAPAVAAAPAAAPVAAEPVSDESKYTVIKSPMIGTFYRSSSPDKDPFIHVGSTISSGMPICIIEAMKLFNEIEAEISGKVVKILVDDATPVEYDQPLFLVDPA